jgi:hypothetical protein
MRARIVVVVSFAVWALKTSSATAAQAFSLEIVWSAPIATDQSGQIGRTTAGLILRAQSALPDGRIAVLASQIASGVSSQVLFNNIDQNRPDDAVTLTLEGAFPAGYGFISRIFNRPNQVPYVSTLAAGMSGEMWVGGASNAYYDFTSSPHSDAYLAKVDPTGKPIWEMAYGNGGQRTLWSIASLPAGDVAVFGREGWGGRVARIGPDGGQLWERLLGNDLGGAIAPLPGDRLAVVGFEATGSGANRDYGDHVTVWILDGSGKQLTQTRIRGSINKSQYSYFGKVLLVTRDDAIYVASNWTGLFDAQPVEIAKLSVDGKLLWSTLLPDTAVVVEKAVRTWKGCSPTLAVMPRGGVLIACALDDQIHLYQLDQSSGAYQESSLPLPDCQTGHPAELFLNIRNDGTTTLSGSRPGSNVAPGRTWIGRLTAIQ